MEEMNQEVMDVKTIEVGDVVTGTVTKVEEKQVLVNIGYKSDGIVPISELSSLHVESASEVVSAGDTLELKVTKIEDDAVILSKRAVDAEKAWEDLESKFNSGEVFDVVIKDVVKGGLVVDLGVRGFIPASLVEAHFVEDFSDYNGKTLAVKLVELDKEKNRVILSHRAVVEEAQSQAKRKTIESLKVGQVLQGTVQRLTDFGAFVDIGGIDGLVHISQLSHDHISKPSEVVTEGESVQVKVLGVDVDNERISLSIKETQAGPWERVASELKVGSVIEGTVRRLVSFGAFVEIFPGVEGLVHISQISNRHIATPQEALQQGEKVKVKVLDINETEKRISLSIRELLEDDEKVDLSEYQPDESTGFSLGDLIGDKLNKLK